MVCSKDREQREECMGEKWLRKVKCRRWVRVEDEERAVWRKVVV